MQLFRVSKEVYKNVPSHDKRLGSLLAKMNLNLSVSLNIPNGENMFRIFPKFEPFFKIYSAIHDKMHFRF